jgi:excinuclease ABC subunit B
MAKAPKKPKDPARPTRAKAARPSAPTTPAALADLLNPAINKGTAGLVSGTGLQPPPDNSFDRRANFSAAHTARKSRPKGFDEAPQRDYSASPITGLDPALARELGLGDDEPPPAPSKDDPKYRLPKADLPHPGSGLSSMGVAATAQAREQLLREGRRNSPPPRGCRTARRGRKNPKAANASRSCPSSSRRATSPRRSAS